MADLTKVNINGTEYNLKDSNALPAVPASHITSVDTLDYNRRGALRVHYGTNSKYYEIGQGKVSMSGNCAFYARLKITIIASGYNAGTYELEIQGAAAGNSQYTEIIPKMYIKKYKQYDGETNSNQKIFEFYFKDTRTNNTFYATRDFEWMLYYKPATGNYYTSVYTEMIEYCYADYGLTYGNQRTQNTYSLWRGVDFPSPNIQQPQTLVTGYTEAAQEHLLYFNKLGDTMLGDLNLGGYSLILRTDTSWDNLDRSIPFGVSNQPSKIAFYKNDFTYNPNTGALKAGSFVKKGGTSAQFLKADGSVDSNTYLTQNTLTVEDLNPTLNYGEQDIKIANINGIGISVDMPEAQHYITGITAGAANSTENSSIANPYIKIKDDSTHRGQIQLKGGGDVSISSDSGGIITITGANTKVTSVANHYTPATNSASSLPTSIAQNVYIKQILRDAKGHVTGANTEELSFSTYGVKVVIPQANMYNYSNGVLVTEGVKEFLQSIADGCISNSYKKFCNGFILNVKDTSDNTLNYIYFRSSTDGRAIVVNTAKPIYFNFLCDNPKGFLAGSSDAFAIIYAYVVDGNPLYSPMNRYIQIMLWYTSGGAVEGYTVCDNGFYNEASTLNATIITSTAKQMNDTLLGGWKNSTAITLNISELDTTSVTLNVDKYGFTSLKKARIVAPKDVMEGKGTLTLTIYSRVVVLDSTYSVADITVAYDVKGNVIDVNIN